MTKQLLPFSDSTTAPSVSSGLQMGAPHMTRGLAQRVLEIIDQGLARGMGTPVPGQMCVEAAVCYALGLPHSDDPGCVAQSLRRLKILLNDARWSSTQARAKGLRRLALAQLGSNDVLDEEKFAGQVVHLVTTKQLPAALRAAASIHKDPSSQAALRAAAAKCESEPQLSTCLETLDITAEAVNALVDVCPTDAITINTIDACACAAAALVLARRVDSVRPRWLVLVVAGATDAAVYAAGCTGRVAAAVGEAQERDACDNSLAEFAEDVVQILIGMKAPGCEWLDLTARI